MKKAILFLLMVMISNQAFAMSKKPANTTDLFFACLDKVTKETCNVFQYDWVNNYDASREAYDACYYPERAKCGCQYNIATECK